MSPIKPQITETERAVTEARHLITEVGRTSLSAQIGRTSLSEQAKVAARVVSRRLSRLAKAADASGDMP